MKNIHFIPLFLLPVAAAFGQISAGGGGDEDQQQQKPPTEIPDYTHLDEYIYQPRSNVVFGIRSIGGAKVSFQGNGIIPAPESVLNLTTPDILRNYHDGNVYPDARGLTVDNGNGTTTTIAVPPDGKTNTWNYTDPRQLTPDGYMQFHLYSAVTDGSGIYTKDGKSNTGMELTATHDMAKIGKHLSWEIVGGLSLNDIQAATSSFLQANVTTVTDTYDLFGQIPGPAPYQSPSTATQNITNSSGTGINDSNNGATTNTVDTTTLIGDAPLNRATTTAATTTQVFDNYKLHGGYLTVRVGPQLTYSFNDHIKFSISAGPALIYSGTTYTITEVLNPLTGPQIVDNIVGHEDRLLPAYYADATLQYDLNETAGFYFGAFDQGSGGYTQTASNPDGRYQTKVEFSNQQGFRTGLTFKF